MTLLPRWVGLGLLVVGVCGLGVFCVRALRSEQPLYPVGELARNRMFGLSNLTSILSYASSYGVPFLVSLYLQHIGKMDAAQAGQVMLAQPVVMAVVVVVSGRLADRVEPRVLATAGLALHAGGLVALSRLGPEVSTGATAAILAVVGAGLGLFSSPNMSAILGSVDRSAYGVAAASAGTMRLLGQSAGMGAVTLLAALLIGPVTIGPAQHDALLRTHRVAFTIFAGVAVAAALASLLRGRLHGGRATGER